MTADFAFDHTRDDEVHVVTLHGELDLSNAHQVRDALVGIAGSAVVVDLADLTFLDSSGIAALLAARKRILDAGHRFSLRGAQGMVRRVLEVTGLEHLLTD